MAIEIKNEKIFGKVIAEALAAIHTNAQIKSWERQRWINAVNKAVEKLGDLKYQMEWMTETKHLLILSDSNEIYEANGTCQCEAFKKNQPCWHRALAKLIKNYLAASEPPPVAEKIPAPESIPYLKPAGVAKPQRVGNYSI